MLAVLLVGTARAQAPEDLRPLAARTFTRSFTDSNVSLEYTLRAGPLMEPGKRRFIEIDIDTLMRAEAQQAGEYAVPLNGFIAIALPRGIEPDGELRMKWYNDANGRYDFMYSAPYPPEVLEGQMAGSAEDAVSNEAQRILAGMRGLSSGLDANINFSGPQDPRLMGGNPDYAITGTSWLIPCDSLFQQLVDPFNPSRSRQFNPRLKATLPVRIGESVANPRIVVYVGSLSTAVTEITVMSDSVPANVRLLEEPPSPPEAAQPAAEDGNEDSATEVSADAAEPAAAVEAAVPLRALLYSFGWAAWENEVDLSPMIIPTALLPDYQPMETEQPLGPVNMDPPAGSRPAGPITISAADQTERRELAGSETEIGSEEMLAEVAEEANEQIEDGVGSDDEELVSEEDSAAAGVEEQPDESEAGDPEAMDDVADAQEQLAPASDEQAAGEMATDEPADESSAGSADEVAPGSLAELKERVEERKERESGNSVNIELPSDATETTPATEAQQAAETVNEAQDAEVQELEDDAGEQAAADDSTEELPERDDIPAFAFPEEIRAAERDDATIEDDAAETVHEMTSGEAEQVREVTPGTLPGPENQYSVPLKQITGRDGRKPGGGSSGNTAPDYTQLYIGGGPSGNASGGTTPADLGDMVFVPGGKFLMGTDELASAGDEDERPLHEVEVADFYIDKYPVTNRQYYQFVLSDGYKPQGNWQKYFEPGTADMPVRGVTWEDANQYCRWAGKRLPTEAEWEKAARGTDGRLYPWGNDWSSDILPRGSLNYRLVLNQKAASPYGALAMVGVLWQWTSSSHAAYPYDSNASGELKVLRGGAFSNGRNIIRCANRYPEDPSVSFNTFTFRCARDKN